MVLPADGPGVVYEFFAPFAHVEGKYEWCRIRSPTHGVLDTFILVGETPVVVYVNGTEGERFMADRYPETLCYRVPKASLRIRESADGRTVEGFLRATVGPVRRAAMTLQAKGDAVPRDVPYGGKGKPVWGSQRWTCWGVDLVLDALADGRVEWNDRGVDELKRTPALVTLGSFGRIAPLAERTSLGRPNPPRLHRRRAPAV